MAITELLPLRTRKLVAWFRDRPPIRGKSAFEERGFAVTSCTDADLRSEAYLAGLAAVVFTQSASKLFEIRRSLTAHASLLLDCDCRVVARPAPNVVRNTNGIEEPVEPLSIIEKAVRDLHLPTLGLPREAPPLPHIRIFDVAASWRDVANYVAMYPPGRAPGPIGELRIAVKDKHGQDITLSPGEDRLIRRAFADCATVHLDSPDESGRSGVSVYRAHVELMGGQLPQFPVPYFVKVGNRKKVFAEYKNYEDYVDPYIPFHLGPHLDPRRCCLGAHDGVIVGDYVEESESLLNCARDGRAASPIACLFDRTLHGWHRWAREKSEPLTKSLRVRLPNEISEARLVRARAMGATRELDELRTLVERCSSTPVLVGFIHGDLHASNVRVRATDAIVIDFFACKEAPLLFELACLEASLLVDGFGDVRINEIDAWFRSIRPLYEQYPLATPAAHANSWDRWSWFCSCVLRDRWRWFRSCVRQIRSHARGMERGSNQYAAALAVALLMKATKDSKVSEPEASRYAAAYVLAEVVLSKAIEHRVEAQ